MTLLFWSRHHTNPTACSIKGRFSTLRDWIAAISISLAVTGCTGQYHSSPTAPRDTNACLKAMAGTLPCPPDPRAFDCIGVSYETNELTITNYRTASPARSDGFAHRSTLLKPGEPLKGSDAVFELVALGVAFPTNPPVTQSGSQSVPITFHGPDGRPLSLEDQAKAGIEKWQRTASIYSYEHWPKLCFLFGSKSCPPGYYSMAGLFDARTRHSLTSGSSYSQVGSNYLGRLEVSCHAWHATPMDLVLDVQLDGKVVLETNWVENRIVSVPGGRVKMVGVWDGKETSCSTYSQGEGSSGAETIEIGLSQPSQEQRSIMVVACDPPDLAVLFECRDAGGKTIAPHGSYGRSGMRILNLSARKTDVSSLRLTTFTNHHQVVIPLPAIQGLPPENQQVTDLFDVRIPRVQFNSEYQLHDFIRKSVQMEFHTLGDIFPKSYFPRVFTNTTPAQLLDTYQRHLTNSFTVVVDPEKHEIRTEKGRLGKIMDWIRRRLGL
jgi:hypothetical protein